MVKTSNLGYPRIGKDRELKRVIERYWSGKTDAADVQNVAKEIRRAAWQTQAEAGLDIIPCNDFTFYDHMLDTSCLWGMVPERFGKHTGQEVDLATYSKMARGDDSVAALEMTKWFDTNYHYLVPEFNTGAPKRTGNGPVDAYREAAAQVGDKARPVIVGPVTFVLLGKHHAKSAAEHVAELVPLYVQLLGDLAEAGADWVQIDEPSLVTDLTNAERELFTSAYTALCAETKRPKIMLQTYFGAVGDNWPTVVALPVEGIGLDFVRGREDNLAAIRQYPDDKLLGAGVVNGRGVWKADLNATLELLDEIAESVHKNHIVVGPSASLMYLPHDVRLETGHDEEVLRNLSFAEQRLAEISILGKALGDGREVVASELAADAKRVAGNEAAETSDPAVRSRAAGLTEDDFRRPQPFFERDAAQKERFALPAYPTTTIGSFPQSPDVRSMRLKVRTGKITQDEYDAWVQGKMDELIAQQEAVGLDVLVHGEFERSDMVEYFGEHLGGFITTENGWVQSYGSRCVRPPIVVGDVHRDHPMTVKESVYAQSKTTKPVKGMLTGPVTILNWSFVRDDLPRSEVCNQIALALRDEVVDLEAAGIGIVQIDEPALREGLPLRRAEWADYLNWAVRAFRLSSSGVKPATQIHTHMCYSEFNDIIDSIEAMDADVISIENSRSNDELLLAFTDNSYERMIGPGVYDIHSPAVPTTDEMVDRLKRATEVLGGNILWVNPDCGLKTRKDEEVWPSLEHMVAAAKVLREA